MPVTCPSSERSNREKKHWPFRLPESAEPYPPERYPDVGVNEDGSTPPVDLAIPIFGYQNHISIDRGFGFIRKWSATDAAAYEGRRLRDGLFDKTNTASVVWADTAYRPAVNEEFM